MITSIMAYATTTFLCGYKKIRARGWLSSPLLRSVYMCIDLHALYVRPFCNGLASLSGYAARAGFPEVTPCFRHELRA